MNLTKDDKCDQTLFLVEADSFATLRLWQDWSSEATGNNCEWKQDSTSYVEEVGRIGERPVCAMISWYLIENIRVGFWEATSMVVDYEIIENWLRKRFKNVKQKTNAINFHNVLFPIQDLTNKKFEYKGFTPIWQRRTDM